MNKPNLFHPLSLWSLNLRNRIVMAPMTRNFSPNGVPGPDVAAYYRRRAEGGVGLIITEGTVINHPASAADHDVPHFYGEDALNGWSQVVKEVHAAGGKIMPQLWHTGMARKMSEFPDSDINPVGPSGLNLQGEQVSNPLNESEIASIVDAYAQAAANAKRLGFDGIELHGAHGYLIDQFFWEKTNRRTDRYGGDLTARTRFAEAVIQACREAVGPDFPIVLRISQWKADNYDAKLADTPDQLAQWLMPLANAGVDIFHCSTRRFWVPEFEGSELNLAGWVKKVTGKPTISVGSVGLEADVLGSANDGNPYARLDALNEQIKREEFDLIAVGRSLLADAAWANKVREGRLDDITPVSADVFAKLT
ncbi:NADH:flavin oxidoreductase [Paenibacillus psychroresistens]|nr:NADH:flavin oxidoreductase [Paenibacillus psychroresistens]